MPVIKTIELVGTSPNNWHEAVANTVEEAAQTIRNIAGVEIIRSSCEIRNNRISLYKVDLKLSFTVERLPEA